MIVPALVAIALGAWSQAPAPDMICARFESPAKLEAGRTFQAPLPKGLEVRLSSGWAISVGPVGERIDYLWLVSPPLRTAPQRYLKGSYGVSDADQPRLERNPLRFVLNRADYDAALASHAWADGDLTLKRLEELGRGVLNIYFDKYELDGDRFRWISFHGEGCVPR